jgi:autophagy-related protein 33
MMESSYEVLGSDNHSEGSAASASGGDDIDVNDVVNGENVRGEVENWLKARIVQTGVTAVAFMISVVGIWGDGAAAMGPEIIYL